MTMVVSGSHCTMLDRSYGNATGLGDISGLLVILLDSMQNMSRKGDGE